MSFNCAKSMRLSDLVGSLTTIGYEDPDIGPPIEVVVSEIYIGNDFEGPLGGKGEFVFHFTATDGNRVAQSSSIGSPSASQRGSYDNIRSEFLPVRELAIWPGASSDVPTARSLHVHANIIERDRSESVSLLLEGLSDAAVQYIKREAGEDYEKAGIKVGDALEEIVADALAGNDLVLQSHTVLDSRLNNHHIGRFMRINGRHSSFFVVMVVPGRKQAPNDWLYERAELNEGESFTLETEPGRERVLSVFTRETGPDNTTHIEVNGRQVIRRKARGIVETVAVGPEHPGRLTVTSRGVRRIVVSAIASTVRSDGARRHRGTRL